MRHRVSRVIGVCVVALAATRASADLLDCPSGDVQPAPGAGSDGKGDTKAGGSASDLRFQIEAFAGPLPDSKGAKSSATTGSGGIAGAGSGSSVPLTGTSGIAGISDSDEPAWTFITDANATSIDTSKLALGAGIERATPFGLWREIIKFSTDGTVDGPVADHAFGAAILEPALAKYSVATRYEWRPWAYVRGCKANGKVHVHTKWSQGLYGNLEVARLSVDATRKDGSELKGVVTPLALSVGYVLRLEGRLSSLTKLGTTDTIVFAPYVGASLRGIGDDIGNTNRTMLFGTKDRTLAGIEFGLGLQISNFIFEPKVTWLTNGENRLNGASGLQFQINLTYALAIGVSGGGTNATTKADVTPQTTQPAQSSPAPENKKPEEPVAPAVAPNG